MCNSRLIESIREFAQTGNVCYMRRLLILSCSQRKRPSQEPLPAIERYDGPLFKVLHRFLRESSYQARGLDVYVLSAAYGLIPGDFPIPLYDQKMNTERAIELQPQVTALLSDLLPNGYVSILFVLGKTYLKTFGNLQGLIPAQVALDVADGPIGKKQTQLKRWLWLSC